MYTSDDVSEIVDDLSKVVNGDHLKKSLIIAQDLCSLIVKTGMFSEASRECSAEGLKKLIEVSLRLSESLTVDENLLLDDAQILECTIGVDALQKVADVSVELQTNLTAVISSLATLVMGTPVTIKEEVKNIAELKKSILPASMTRENELMPISYNVTKQKHWEIEDSDLNHNDSSCLHDNEKDTTGNTGLEKIKDSVSAVFETLIVPNLLISNNEFVEHESQIQLISPVEGKPSKLDNKTDLTKYAELPITKLDDTYTAIDQIDIWSKIVNFATGVLDNATKMKEETENLLRDDSNNDYQKLDKTVTEQVQTQEAISYMENVTVFKDNSTNGCNRATSGDDYFCTLRQNTLVEKQENISEQDSSCVLQMEEEIDIGKIFIIEKHAKESLCQPLTLPEIIENAIIHETAELKEKHQNNVDLQQIKTVSEKSQQHVLKTEEVNAVNTLEVKETKHETFLISQFQSCVNDNESELDLMNAKEFSVVKTKIDLANDENEAVNEKKPSAFADHNIENELLATASAVVVEDVTEWIKSAKDITEQDTLKEIIEVTPNDQVKTCVILLKQTADIVFNKYENDEEHFIKTGEMETAEQHNEMATDQVSSNILSLTTEKRVVEKLIPQELTLPEKPKLISRDHTENIVKMSDESPVETLAQSNLIKTDGVQIKNREHAVLTDNIGMNDKNNQQELLLSFQSEIESRSNLSNTQTSKVVSEEQGLVIEHKIMQGNAVMVEKNLINTIREQYNTNIAQCVSKGSFIDTAIGIEGNGKLLNSDEILMEHDSVKESIEVSSKNISALAISGDTLCVAEGIESIVVNNEIVKEFKANEATSKDQQSCDIMQSRGSLQSTSHSLEEIIVKPSIGNFSALKVFIINLTYRLDHMKLFSINVQISMYCHVN